MFAQFVSLSQIVVTFRTVRSPTSGKEHESTQGVHPPEHLPRHPGKLVRAYSASVIMSCCYVPRESSSSMP